MEQVAALPMNYRPLSHADDSDLIEIKETLSELLDVLRMQDAEPRPAASEKPASDVTPGSTLSFVKRLLDIRTAQRRFLPPAYFDGPALTVLLDLYVSDRENRQVVVSDAVTVSGAPMSTALRWIATMAADGYVTKQPDPTDKRRTLLRATPRALTEIERLTALWREAL